MSIENRCFRACPFVCTCLFFCLYVYRSVSVFFSVWVCVWVCVCVHVCNSGTHMPEAPRLLSPSGLSVKSCDIKEW